MDVLKICKGQSISFCFPSYEKHIMMEIVGGERMSIIGINKMKIGEIPVLEVVPNGFEGKPLPTLLYFHGFSSAKEHNLPFAYMLAQRGFRIVLPDSLHHGEREKNISEDELQLSFWNIVLKNIEESNMIYTYLHDNDLIEDNRIGVAGTSMGGITVSSMLSQYDWIKAAGIFMGTAQTTTYAKQLLKHVEQQGVVIPVDEISSLLHTIEEHDLTKQMHLVQNRPIFIWHGKKDAVIPFTHAEEFYQLLKKHGGEQANIVFEKDEQAGHKVSRKAFLAGADWAYANV